MVAEVLTSGFRFSIITACRFSNGRNRNEMVVLIEAVSRMRDGFNCRCNDFPPDFSSVSLFFFRVCCYALKVEANRREEFLNASKFSI